MFEAIIISVAASAAVSVIISICLYVCAIRVEVKKALNDMRAIEKEYFEKLSITAIECIKNTNGEKK